MSSVFERKKLALAISFVLSGSPSLVAEDVVSDDVSDSSEANKENLEIVDEENDAGWCGIGESVG